MPLEDFIPRIDNRRFEDIIDEVRTRIPQYTREWTDFNDNDPGIAMIQVFAWMTDLLIYRLGQVPALNYLKFLQLIGIELRPAEPARAEVSFPVVSTHAEPAVIVPQRTEVASESDEGELLIFETERALVAHRASLAAVQLFDGFSFTLLTEANNEALRGFAPLGPQANPGSALMLGFNEALAPQVELSLTFWVSEQVDRAGAVACGLPDFSVFSASQLAWEFWNGREWQPLTLLKDETVAFTRFGHVFLRTPANGAMQAASIGAVQDMLYWIRARLVRSAYERPPVLLAVRTNTVSAVQAETVEDEVLGGSDGAPNQTFLLENSPVLAGTLVLEVDEGTTTDVWTEVEDFFGSGPRDQHFVLNRTSGEIRFGDGEQGRIPVANVENPVANVVARTYRFGGGARGNVSAGKLNTLLSSLDGIDANGITNLFAASGGRDEETLAEARKRAPQTLKSKSRAVTPEDFEALARQAANIERARALPLHHPNFPDVPVPGVVTVIVVPDEEGPAPTPSEGTLRAVCAYLDQRRLLTTEVYVAKPTYKLVEIRGAVIANNDADLAEVKLDVEQALLDYFHPLQGGEDGQGWPFGQDIFFSQVFQHVFSVPGVQRIQQLLIVLDGEVMPECRDVPIPEGALLYSTRHDIQVHYAFDA